MNRGDVLGLLRAHLAQPLDAHEASMTADTIRSRSPCDNDGCTGSDRHSAAAFSVSGRSTATWNGVSRWFGTG